MSTSTLQNPQTSTHSMQGHSTADRFADHTVQYAPANSPSTLQENTGLLLPDPAEVFAAPGYTMPAPLHNSLAMVASVMATIGFFIPPLLVVALLLGCIALFYKRHGIYVGRRQALAAIAVSALGIILWSFPVFFFFFL